MPAFQFFSVLAFSVLLRRNVLEPLDDFSIQSLLDGYMCHCRSCICAMPVLLTRRKPSHIAWPNFFNRSAFTLCPSKTGCDDQRLA